MPEPTITQRAMSAVVGNLILGRLSDGIKPVISPDGRHHIGFELMPTAHYQGRHRATEVAAA